MEVRMTTKRNDKKNDEAVDMTFPASDATAHGPATGTEPPTQPVDRKPPVITREQIEQAQSGEGHKHQKKENKP
jgi:hypothetical protein